MYVTSKGPLAPLDMKSYEGLQSCIIFFPTVQVYRPADAAVFPPAQAAKASTAGKPDANSFAAAVKVFLTCVLT